MQDLGQAAALVLDANGAYRAQAVLRVSNATEQFLAVDLPAGAKLWTAVVANEPVKPAEGSNSSAARMVRCLA